MTVQVMVQNVKIWVALHEWSNVSAGQRERGEGDNPALARYGTSGPNVSASLVRTDLY